MLLRRVYILCAGIATCLAGPPDRKKCRVLPGDRDWPNEGAWQKLNKTVSGRLIAAKSPGYVCHDPTYDEEACKALQTTWTLPQMQWPEPAGFLAAYQQNASCNPYTPRETPCLQGNYVKYAINVSSPADVVAGVNFARKNNIRLVIKNTGHDYLGKSTGAGALSIWTHHLKDIEFIDYKSKAYTGRAAKFGAGVQSFEAYRAASAVGLEVVGGECPTVGIAGGYTQGGGHSLLTSKYGMGADQALEWEVVTSEGKLVTATPTKNADLYWALSGGGGGTYGVVTSLTVKAHPDEQFGGANGGFASAGIPQDTYWGAVENFTGVLPALVDAGAHVTWIVQAEFFTLYEVTIPGGNGDQIRELLLPFSTWLDEHNVPYQINFTTFDNYQSHVDHYLGPPPYGYDAHSSLLEGGVMLDRGTVKTSWSDIAKTMRKMATEKGWFYPAYAMNASRMPAVPNAVLPGWRDQLVYLEVQKYWNFTVPFSVMEEERKFLTETIMPPLQDLAIGAYMNEADFANPRWKEEYYGRNYGRLRQVKKKYDPTDLLYAKTAVGSDEWDVDASGRLCRVRSTIF